MSACEGCRREIALRNRGEWAQRGGPCAVPPPEKRAELRRLPQSSSPCCCAARIAAPRHRLPRQRERQTPKRLSRSVPPRAHRVELRGLANGAIGASPESEAARARTSPPPCRAPHRRAPRRERRNHGGRWAPIPVHFLFSLFHPGVTGASRSAYFILASFIPTFRLHRGSLSRQHRFDHPQSDSLRGPTNGRRTELSRYRSPLASNRGRADTLCLNPEQTAWTTRPRERAVI